MNTIPRRLLRRLLLLLAMIAAVGLLAFPSTPATKAFGCTAADKKYCENWANFVLTTCTIVHPTEPDLCINAACDYWDNCLAEKGCPQQPRLP